MRTLAAVLALPLLCGHVLLAQANPAITDLLYRIRIGMRDNLDRLPNYTCRLTIERSTQAPGAHRFNHVDTAHLEVGYVDGKELYAWPGQKFEGNQLDRMLPAGGAVGTGDFALHARAIFLSGAPTFVYKGRTDENGKAVVQFDYNIPREKSRYALGNGADFEVVGYHGAIWADAHTLRPLRVEIDVDDVPSRLKITSATNKLTYMVAKIGGADFLLPDTSELLLRDANGRVNRNLTRFDQCRQYQGESVLSFADPDAASAPVQTVTEVNLPAGLFVEMILRTELQFDHMAVGDPIAATVAHDVSRSGAVMVPKGAAVTGHITRITSGTNGRVAYRAIGLELDAVDFTGHHAEFTGTLETFAYAAAQITVSTSGQAQFDRREPRAFRDLQPGEGMVFIRGQVSHIPSGAHMYWRTVTKQKVAAPVK